MSFLSIFSMFVNWPVALLIGVIILGAIAIAYFEGTGSLLADAANPRYWLVIIGAIVIVALLHANSTIQKQQQAAAVAHQTITSQKDSQAVVTDVQNNRQHNAVVSHKVHNAILTAPVGGQEDAVWDAIIEQQQSSGTGAGTPPQ